MMTKITLEDKGQDILWFKVNEEALSRRPVLSESIWKGAYIPFWAVRVGQLMPIHHYPHIIHGFLKYRVEVNRKESSHETETSIQPQGGA